jgi:hypothetical protein
MIRKNDFERFARCCTRLADDAGIEDAAVLLMMAQAWTELADWAESIMALPRESSPS